MILQSDHRAESRKWITHFILRKMTALYVSPMAAPQLTAKDVATLTKSIQQFQLGEGSKGQRLLERGAGYAQSADDPHFFSALNLFVKEEQQHSRYLEAFMQSQGIPLVGHHWVDTVFRKLRGLAGLELSLAVLVTAEFIAVPYYRALRDATGSPILKTICRRILEDEAAHLRFQSSMIARVTSNRHPLLQRVLGGLHRFFLHGTILVVWAEHHGVFEAAGYDFRRFKEETLAEFAVWENSRRRFASLHDAPAGFAARLPETWRPGKAAFKSSHRSASPHQSQMIR